jgi:membrane-associated protein
VVRDLIEAVAGLHGAVLLLVVAGLAFGESAILLDVLVPGEVGMVLAGAAGAEAGMALPALIGVAALGALAGDTVSYLVGRRFGPALAHRWRWTRARVAPRLERAHHHFENGGGGSVFVARWVGALRAVVPLVAGGAGMSFGRFLAWDALASLSWSTAIVSAGFVFGDDVASVVDRSGRVLSGLVLVGLIVWWWARRRRVRRR